jgi:MFS family permease
MESTFALFCEHQIGLKPFGVGGLLAEVGVISVIIQGFMIGKLTRRFGEIKLTLWGLVVESIGFLLTVLVHTVAGMMLVLPLYGVGSAILNPSISSLLSRAAPEDRQGDALGVGQGMGALGRVLGPVWGTWLFQRFEPDAPYISAGIMMTIIGILCIIRLRKLLGPVITQMRQVAA